MGHLRYGSPTQTYEVDDSTLAHVQLVAIAKLRRGEPFALVLPSPTGGRITMWVNPSSTLTFEIDAEPGPIDRAWLDELIEQANGSRGLRLDLPRQ